MSDEDLNANQLETIFYQALRKGDAEGVRSALTLMAYKDANRAAELYDALKTALDIATTSRTVADRPIFVRGRGGERQ